jgi:glutathione S-transferase
VLKLYDCQTAPSPRRVRVFAAEKQIELHKIEVDLSKGDQFRAAFRDINPDCVVPVLELDDGTRLSEVTAICHYLEEIHPEPPLFGRTAVERATALMWNVKVEQNGLLAMQEAFRNAARGLQGRAVTGPVDFEQIPALAERGRRRVSVFIERLDQELAGREFIAGDNYSIADVTAMVFVDFAGWIKIAVPAEAGNLRRWYDAVSSRPSARA